MKHLLGMALLGAATLAFSGGPATAQSPSEEIAVVAPHQVTHKTVGHGSLGLPVEQVTITHQVAYKDLDLKSATGTAALEKRINDVAKQACHQLDELYPKSRVDNIRCELSAKESAGAQMQAVIAAAKQ